MFLRFNILCLLCIFAFSTNQAFAAAAMQTAAKQAIVVDYETGTILYEKNADDRMPTSSMSKVMTMYLVFDALQKGQVALDSKFTVSEKAWRKQGSKMFVEVDKKVQVEDLIRGVIVQSGNDATIVLAEGLAGSEDAFALAMNEHAKDLGMNNSHFANASGWPDPNHYSTARDLSKLAIAMIKNFPEYYGYYAEKSFEFSGIKQDNRNPLLYRKIGADGLKTGHTEDGGYGLIGTGVKDGRRVVLVLNGMASMQERAEESARLLSWGLNSFETVTLFEDNKPLDHISVYLGKKGRANIAAQEPVTVIVQKLLRDQIDVKLQYNAPLKAPVAKDTVVGTVQVSVPQGDTHDVPLVTLEAVEELGMFAKLIAKARLLTTGQGKFSR